MLACDGQRDHGVRVGEVEARAERRQAVEVRRGRLRPPYAAERVGAQRVDRDQEDVLVGRADEGGAVGAGEETPGGSQPPATRRQERDRPNAARGRDRGGAAGGRRPVACALRLALRRAPSLVERGFAACSAVPPASPSLVAFHLRHPLPSCRRACLSSCFDRSARRRRPDRIGAGASPRRSPTSSRPARSPRASGRPSASRRAPARRPRCGRRRGRASPGSPSCAGESARTPVPA